MSRSVFALAIIALLSACAAGPDYVPPASPSDDVVLGRYQPSQTDSASIGFEPETDWWEMFQDPLLTKLIEDAATQNFDIKIATENVRTARAVRQLQLSSIWPQIGASGSYDYQRASENGAINLGALRQAGVAQLETDLIQLGFDASWEIDVFGGRARRIEAASAQADSAIERRRDVLITIISEIARNYGELRGAQERIQAIEKSAKIQRDTLKLVKVKFQSGLGSQLDVTRAQANVSATEARIPAVRAAERAAAFRLGLLTGRQPTALLETLIEAAPLPPVPDSVPTGLQSTLLVRRPDVRRAERDLAAATANIGVAVSEFYPKFFLTGSTGQQSTTFSDLFETASSAWSIGPSIRFPLFTGGRLNAGLQVAEAQRNIAVSRFKQTFLIAVEDVETSLVQYVEAQRQTEKLRQAVSASETSVELAKILYEEGLGEFLDVLDAERTLSDLEDQLAASQTETFLRTVSLYKALGGGWRRLEKDFSAQTIEKDEV